MIAKALGVRFWKSIRQRRSKVERLGKVDHVYRFMKQIRGNREVFKKELSPAEKAEQERVAAVSLSYVLLLSSHIKSFHFDIHDTV